MTQRRVVPFDAVDQPEPGMRSSDRLGPWFDLDGSEIIPLGTEAVERVVERIIGAFQLWSNLPRSTAPAWSSTSPCLPSSSSRIGRPKLDRYQDHAFLTAYAVGLDP